MMTMITSSSLGLISTSMFYMWLMSEINFFSFLLMLKLKNKKNTNENVTYFFIQSFASVILIFSLIMTHMSYFYPTLTVISLLMKMGLIPFQTWYLNIINSIPWMLIWFLGVWMKIIYLKMINSFTTHYIYWISALNIAFSTLNLIKEKSIKMILGLSSIFNIAWIMLSLKMKKIWLFFLILYGSNFFMFLKFTESVNLLFISPKFVNFNMINKMFILFMLLFLMGLPPFPGFLLKIMILTALMKSFFFLVLIITLSTIFFMFFYLMMFFLFLSKTSINLSIPSPMNYFFWTYLMMVNFCFTPLIFYLYYLNNTNLMPLTK